MRRAIVLRRYCGELIMTVETVWRSFVEATGTLMTGNRAKPVFYLRDLRKFLWC